MLWCRQTGTSLPFKLHGNPGVNRDLSVFHQLSKEVWRKRDYNVVMAVKDLSRKQALCVLKDSLTFEHRYPTGEEEALSWEGVQGMLAGKCSVLPPGQEVQGEERGDRGTTKRWFSCHEGDRFCSWLPVPPLLYFFDQGMSKWEYIPTSASSLWCFGFADSRSEATIIFFLTSSPSNPESCAFLAHITETRGGPSVLESHGLFVCCPERTEMGIGALSDQKAGSPKSLVNGLDPRIWLNTVMLYHK